VAGTAQREPVAARFGALGSGGGYESFYLRAVDPARPRGVWLRHTIHQAPGHGPVGSIWVTLLDADAPAPVTHKLTVPSPQAVEGGGVRIGESVFGADAVRGGAGPGASWDLRWDGDEPPLRHLPKAIMYSAPLPRTKLESPHPAARFAGRVTVGDTTLELDGWPGMVGHNWGAQHAERWIWLHGVAFDGMPDAWLDLSLGRVRLGPFTTPWIANGAVSVGGHRVRLGGTTARAHVHEHPLALDLRLTRGHARVRLTVHSRRPQTAVWRYADPDGSEHHVANCSVAELEAVVHPEGGTPLTLRTAHGGTYELGMREHTHGLPVQPFPDP
jgi:hypothetical protein